MSGNQQMPAGEGAVQDRGLYFAHLSDPHLTSLDGVRWRQLLSKRMLGYLSWRHRRRAEHRREVLDVLLEDLAETRPEHIVITGDLTHTGLPDEFHQARLWLDSLGAAERVTVVPGNHDCYVRAPWSSTFSLWEPFMCSDAPVPGAQALFPILRVRNGIALIGLSSACPTAPFLATGSLGRAQLERLQALLLSAAEQRLFRIVMLHHAPQPGAEIWRKRLTDARALSRVLERAGAELVLHGHGHRTLHTELRLRGRRIPVFGLPSASASGALEGRRAQYFLYRVAPAAGGWTLHVSVRGYRPERARFCLEHEHHLSVAAMASTSP